MLDALVRRFFEYKLSTLALNLMTFPVLRRGGGERGGVDGPRASILVPARDEAHNLARTLPALLSQGAFEVIVLDDGSTDGTGDLARGLGATVLTGAELPPGWLGKSWACAQLAARAKGEVLIFTDADVLWREGALPAVLGELARSRADLLTVWPRQEAGTLGERFIVPLNDDVLLSLLPAPLIRLPFPGASAGNGQLMAFRRACYEFIGGHESVRGEVLEDMKLAARVKARGGRLAIALGGRYLSVRMYRSYRETVEGFGKSLDAAHASSKVLLTLSWGLHLLAYTLPLFRRQPQFLLSGLLERLLVNLKTGRATNADVLEVLLTPLAPLAALPIYLRALRGSYTWKGRTYARGGAGDGAPPRLPSRRAPEYRFSRKMASWQNLAAFLRAGYDFSRGRR